MKSKIIALATTLILVALTLSACSGRIVRPTRGEWSNDIYSSEYLGLHFVLPAGWATVSDEELAVIMNLSAPIAGYMGMEIPDDMDEFHEMMAVDPVTRENVNIIFINAGTTRAPSVRRMNAEFSAALNSPNITITQAITSDTVTIGNYEWHHMSVEMTMLGSVLEMRQFYNFHAGYFRAITITRPATSGMTFDDILAYFISLDDDIPERNTQDNPQTHTAELIGTWLWDDDELFTYTLHADGSGYALYDGDRTDFVWHTESGNHLLMHIEGLPIADSWTYSIENNILTLASRQLTDIIFTYTLVE